MDSGTLEKTLSTQGVLDKSMLAEVVAKCLSCGAVNMLVINWLACWFVSSELRQFVRLTSSLLYALPITTVGRLSKASALSSVDSNCLICSQSCLFEFGFSLCRVVGYTCLLR